MNGRCVTLMMSSKISRLLPQAKHFLLEARRSFIKVKQSIRSGFRLDNFSNYIFIVGAQKSGTTALYSYLIKHPDIAGVDFKEAGFFNRDTLYERGINYYRSLFPISPRKSHALDATPEYLYYPCSAKRIYTFSPNARIIVLLREPTSRAFSAFNMYQQLFHKDSFIKRQNLANKGSSDFFLPIIEGKVRPDLAYFLDRELHLIDIDSKAEEPSLIRRGLYAPQLERYFRLFSRENVLVIFSNDLKEKSMSTVNRVLDFVGLESMNSSEYPLRHVRKYTSDQHGKELIRQYASDLFTKDKLILYSFYGLRVPW